MKKFYLNKYKVLKESIQLQEDKSTELAHMVTENALKDYVETVSNVHKKKKKIVFVMQGVGIVLLCSILIWAKSMTGMAKVQEGIANEIIRFHVLANSDSDEDQALKLKVKNEVVRCMQQEMAHCSDKEEARRYIIENSDHIKEIAESVIAQEGYSYSVEVRLETTYFPIKTYGDLTFPEGEYEALRILIGDAEGKNWWCVMYPSLCMVNESYSIVPEESKDTLRTVLSTEEYDCISNLEDVTVSEEEAVMDYEVAEVVETVEESEVENSTTEEGGKIEYRSWIFDFITNIF